MSDTAAPTPAPETGSSWLRLAAEIAIVTALSLVTFAKCLNAQFQFLTSDYDWLALAKYGNSELEPLKKTLTAYRSFAGALFDGAYSVFGDQSGVSYRVTLLIIHIINSVLCGRLIARILRRPQAAWIAAALFAIAPASSEAVHSIAAFVYPCITLILLLGLILYDQAIKKHGVFSYISLAIAFLCFGLAALLREHWMTALPLIVLLEIANAKSFAVFKTKGPWIRFAPAIAGGAGFLIYRHFILGVSLVPAIPEYQFDSAMVSRLIVTLQRLVLPPAPLDITEYLHVHQAIGVVLIAGAVFAIIKGNSGDRWRAGVLFVALFVALAPFLPVTGNHIRPRFAYFGTVFASGLAAYAICIISERMSPRLTIPIVLAMLVGLQLEQQTEFERDYTISALESNARIPSYKLAAEWVAKNDDIAFFVGDRQPSLVGIGSTFRVLTGVTRKQLIQIKVSNSQEFFQKYDEIRARSKAKGVHRIFVRGADGYDYIRVAGLDEAIRHIFQTGVAEKKELTILVLLPRPLEPK
ncbi:MAG: hypothetical protein ACKVS6_02590 [Planctomycetota bacterium]